MTRQYDDVVAKLSGARPKVKDDVPTVDYSVLTSPTEINFQTMTREVARASAVGLSISNLWGPTGSMVTPTHVEYWIAMGNHLLAPPGLYFSGYRGKGGFETMTLMKLFPLVLGLMSRKIRLRSATHSLSWIDVALHKALPGPEVYLIYPLLDSLVRRALPRYFNLDGSIKEDFSVGHPESGKRNKYTVKGKFCSSLWALLTLYLEYSPDEEIVSDIKKIFDHIEEIHPGRKAAMVISNDWRNRALHGVDTDNATGVLLNLTLLIAMTDIDDTQWHDQYDQIASYVRK